MHEYSNIELSGKTNIVKETVAHMNRTLLIGVGGSGKEVLFRLRRKFFETKKVARGYDFIEYLWIDTDSRNVDIMQNKYDVINDKLQLPDDDILNISMQSDELRRIYGNINQYPHIQKWFNKEELEKLGHSVLAQGASAIRPFGRLAFWWNYSKIEKKIRSKLNNLSKTTLNTDPTITLGGASNIEIYVVGSLAGGTGSGIFLDLGFLLGKLSPNYIRNAFLFLSDVFDTFDSQKDIRSANCYAALQELNFYMNPENSRLNENADNTAFHFDWDNSGDTNVDLPVFTSTYLVSNKYSNGDVEAIVEDPFDMVADYLFLDFDTSSFGQQKRSSRTNARQSADMKAIIKTSIDKQTIVYPFSCGYQVFGLGQIRLNISKAKNWAQYKYLSSLFGAMLASDTVNNSAIQNNKGEFVLQNNFSLEKISYDLENRDNPQSLFARTTKNLKDTAQNLAQKHSDRIIVPVNNIKQLPNDLLMKYKEIEKELDKEKDLLHVKLESNSSVKGEIVRVFEESKNSIVSKLKDEILSYFYSLLGDFEHNGISTVEAFIKRCSEALELLEKQNNNILREKQDYVSMSHAVKEFTLDGTSEIVLKRLSQADEIPSFLFGFKKIAKDYYEGQIDSTINSIKHSAMQYLKSNVGMLQENIISWFSYNYNNLKHKFVQDIIYQLRMFVQDEGNSSSLVYRLNTYKNNVRQYYNLTEEYVAAFTAENKNPRRRWVLDDFKEWDTKYQEYTRSSVNSVSFAETLLGFFKRFDDYENDGLPITDSLQKLCYLLSIVKDRKLFESFEKSAKEMYDEFLKEMSVAKKLNELYNRDLTGVSGNLKDLVEHSIFKVPFEHYHSGINDNLNGSSYKTVINACPDESYNVEESINSVIKPNGEETFVKHNSPEHITFFIESGGYPLFYISTIPYIEKEFGKNISTDPQNIYKRYLSKSFSYIKGLLPPNNTRELKQYLEDVFPVVKAIMMKKIQYKPALNDDSVSYFYFVFTDKQNIKRQNQLGQTIEQVVKQITGNEELKRNILNLIDKSDNFKIVELMDFYRAINRNMQQIADKRQSSSNEVDPIEYALGQLEEDVRAQIIENKLESKDYETEDEVAKFIRDDIEKYRGKNLAKIEYYTAELKEGFYTM